ncbi:MAG: bifunctional diguanylate cyclase/phosphodiesterase [Spirochaetia bacterium]
MGFLLSFIFLVINLFTYRFSLIYLYVPPPVLFLSIFVLLHKTGKIERSSGFLLLSLLVSIGLYSVGLNNLGVLFTCVFPPIAYFLYGKRRGLQWVLPLNIGYGILTTLFLLNLITTSLSPSPLFLGFAILILISAFTYLIEAQKERIGSLMRDRIYYDQLTHLPNRVLLLRHISEANSPALILINIDDFKEINATYGYRAGDRVLQCAADKLNQILPDSATGVYRLNADEFAVLIQKGEDTRFRKSLTNIANLINRFLRHEKCIFQKVEIRFRASMGIAIADEVGTDKLFACADIALKTAKSTNTSFLFYRQALDTQKRYEENIKWANVLTDALDNGRVVPFYQPIIDNKTGEIVKYEALVRLINAEGEVITPHFFLDIAKKSRLHTRITKIILIRASEFLLANPTGVSINLSFEDILDQSVKDYIDRIYAKNPTIFSRLCFELTESEGIQNFDIVSRFIKEMKQRGCQVAIDDFGTGYSNFDYLIRLDVDVLKIDGSLIRNIQQERNSRLIVENIVDFTRKMGIKTVAEFVESEALLTEVKRLKIDYSQGYYIGKPKPVTREFEIDTEVEEAEHLQREVKG